MDDARWHAFLVWLAAQGIARERAYEMLEAPRVLVDGTGVGSNTPFDARIGAPRQYGGRGSMGGRCGRGIGESRGLEA